MFDLYGILGIRSDATPEEVEAQYQYLRSTIHPGEGAHHTAFQEWNWIEMAYNILRNETKRADHDKSVREAEEAAAAKGETGPVTFLPESVVLPTSNVVPQARFTPPQHIRPVPVAEVPLPPVQNPAPMAVAQPTPPAPVAQPTPPAPVAQPTPPAPVAQPAPVVQQTALPVSEPVPAKPRQNRRTETPTSEVYQSAGTSGIKAEIRKPVMNWESMSWFNRNYSKSESVKTPNPGLVKGFWGTIVFCTTVFILGYFAGTYHVKAIAAMPIASFVGIMVIVAWVKYMKLDWRKKSFFLWMGLLAAAVEFSILFGKRVEAESPTMVPAIVSFVFCVFAALIGPVAADKLGGWMRIVSARRLHRKVVSSSELKKKKIWGNAGELEGAIGKFGAENVALGMVGEKLTAELFEELLKIPGTRIMHGLKFPRSEEADVDHAVVNGNKIAFVDSKMWAAGDYSWDNFGGIVRRNDENFTEIGTNFHHAVLAYAKQIPEAEIRGRILIHTPSGKPINVDNTNADRSAGRHNPMTELTNPQQFFEEIGNWFSEGKPGIINKPVMNVLVKNLKP